MRWRRQQRVLDPPAAERARDPLVLAVTEPITRETAQALVTRVERVATTCRVLLDLTAIPAFDSDGAAALVRLQDTYGPDRVGIVGLRQAVARLVGSADGDEPKPLAVASPWVLRRLRAIAVVQTSSDERASTAGLDDVLRDAMAENVGIVVVDLRNTEVTATGVDAIAFASSQAALHGQELLIVNVDGPAGDRLRNAGLSATTYVAPEPLD